MLGTVEKYELDQKRLQLTDTMRKFDKNCQKIVIFVTLALHRVVQSDNLDLCRESKTIYQFHGCYFHGCPECYPDPKEREEVTENRKRSFEERYQSTLKMTESFEELGYEVSVSSVSYNTHPTRFSLNRLLKCGSVIGENNENKSPYPQNISTPWRNITD